MCVGMLGKNLDMHGKECESAESVQAVIRLGDHAGTSPEAEGRTDVRRAR